jgi:hypothetical protein
VHLADHSGQLFEKVLSYWLYETFFFVGHKIEQILLIQQLKKKPGILRIKRCHLDDVTVFELGKGLNLLYSRFQCTSFLVNLDSKLLVCHLAPGHCTGEAVSKLIQHYDLLGCVHYLKLLAGPFRIFSV